ncbi:hypothetical protein DWB61_17490 [Ancylomarina euxinus]|uniref:Uncharacterized protein n=1 Tax=Ancylomarina euxinus TaxID=2283627 RepID=A0A425XWF3_9BACT|nr:hypothetical protein [Ancylomarina euxinus]MCZ4696456.1 hypothetical protein [Ancylomarina euxinus]MUP16819.1 hypothetical protein [Ancylomarina euxinus]RRG18965.1 hypothetical protein DWB61_17490 [Ancylomarina euxinus]
MEVQRIRSVLFLWQKLCLLLSGGLLIVSGVLFLPGKYSGKIYIERFDVPSWCYLLGYFIILVIFCLSFYLLIAKWYNRDMLKFEDRFLKYKTMDLFVSEINDLTIEEHPLKYKPKENRTIFNGGGNNWLRFEYRGKKYNIEYFLRNKEEEEELKGIFKKWQFITDIHYGVSKEQELLELYDSLSYKSKYDEFKFT